LKQLSLPAPTHGKALKALAQLPQLRVDTANASAAGVSVSLARLNTTQNDKYNIFAPRYPKPQTEGFFVIVSDAANGDVLGLKRVSWPSPDKVRNPKANPSKPSTRATIRLPPSHSERKVNIQVVSDSYIDMQWTLEDVAIPAEELAPESIYVEAPAGKPEKPT
jgi:antiviral helicase SLH1